METAHSGTQVTQVIHGNDGIVIHGQHEGSTWTIVCPHDEAKLTTVVHPDGVVFELDLMLPGLDLVFDGEPLGFSTHRTLSQRPLAALRAALALAEAALA